MRLTWWLMIALIALVAAGKPVLYDTLDPDCFWHLEVAAQIEREGVRPLVDQMSWSSRKEVWTPYSWLAELGMKRLWDWGGYRAAVAATALMSAAFVVLIAISSRSVAVTGMVTLISLPYLSFRPATLAIVLLAATMFALRSKRQWLAIPLTALLANVHLFVFLVPVWAIVIGVRRWTLVGLIASSCATPLLPGVIKTIVHYQLFDPMVASGAIAEMQPFWRGTMGFVSAAILVVFALIAIARRAQLDRRDWLMLGISTVLLIMKGRYAPLFAIGAAPALAKTMVAWRGESRVMTSRAVRLAYVIVLLLGVVRIIAAFPARTVSLDSWVNRHVPSYPTGAAAFVESRITPSTHRLINEFTWGGYLHHRLPAYQTAMDGRTQCFTTDFWKATCLGDDAARCAWLRGVQADAALVPKVRSIFRDGLEKMGWSVVYQDEVAIVMTPRPINHGRNAHATSNPD